MKLHYGRRTYVFLGVMMPRDFKAKCQNSSVGELKKLHKIKSMTMGSALQGVGLNGALAFIFPPSLVSASICGGQFVVATLCRGVIEAASLQKGVNLRNEIGRKRYYLAGALLKIALFSLSLGQDDFVRVFDFATEKLIDLVDVQYTAQAIGDVVASVVGELCPGADKSQIADAIGGEILSRVDGLVDSMQEGLGEALGYGNETVDDMRNVSQFPESLILKDGLGLDPDHNLSWSQAAENLARHGPQQVAMEVGARALVGEANVLPMLAEESFMSCVAASWDRSNGQDNTASNGSEGGSVYGGVAWQGPINSYDPGTWSGLES